MARATKLRELSGRLPIREWRPATWTTCAWCEGSVLFGAIDGDERIHETDHLVCPDCGALHLLGYDEDGPVAELTSELPARLRPSALAAFRRLLRIADPAFRDPWDEHDPWEAWTSAGDGAGLVACPVCGAAPGQQCSTRDGWERGVVVHAERADVPAPLEDETGQGSIPGLEHAGSRVSAGRVRLPAPGDGRPSPIPEAVEGGRSGDLDGATGSRGSPAAPSGSPTSELSRLHRYVPGENGVIFEIPATVATALKWCDDDRVRTIGDAARAEYRARTGHLEPPAPGPADLLLALRELVGDDDELLSPGDVLRYLRDALDHRDRISRWLGELDSALGFGGHRTQDGGPAGREAQRARRRAVEALQRRAREARPPRAPEASGGLLGAAATLVDLVFDDGDPVRVALPEIPRSGDTIEARCDGRHARWRVLQVVWTVDQDPRDHAKLVSAAAKVWLVPA